MIYQKMLSCDTPYSFRVSQVTSFEKHRHPEVELCYCTEGTYHILCENIRYTLSAGDFLIIGSMVAHEIVLGSSPARHIVLELGYALLGNHFDAFINQSSVSCIFRNSDLRNSKHHQQMVALLEETANLQSFPSDVRELTIKGKLYTISALLLQMIRSKQDTDIQIKDLSDVKKIDHALEIIHNQYPDPLTVDTTSRLCGYSKSNFCRIFKKITGNTFHNALNRRRVDVACALLRQTDAPIEQIAQETGFVDAKSFCRVFKSLTGITARDYRKMFKGN